MTSGSGPASTELPPVIRMRCSRLFSHIRTHLRRYHSLRRRLRCPTYELVAILVICLSSLLVGVAGQLALPWYRDVKIPQGIARGILMRSQRGKDFYGFIGIPYATPPLGHLRFRVSVPHAGWSGLYDATKYRPPCPQLDVRGNALGSEDCLYLNVFSPAILIRENRLGTQPPLLPVMVYIQGESFENGDSALYGPEKLLDKEVLLVTFNYRLGVLGFLSTGDEVASGNWGLHDQKLVIEWIHKNIPLFGGDPTRVTLFGQGAGAASALFLVMSPLTQGLVHRVILQSGSALCDWATEKSPLIFMRKVAASLQCDGISSAELVECLRKKPIDQLLLAQSQGKIFGEFPQRAAPVVERVGQSRLITDEPKVMLEKYVASSDHIPIMAGVTRDETSYFYPLLVQAFQYRMGSGLLERDLLGRFLEAATPFKGAKKDEIIESVLFTYFNAMDPTNATSLSLRFINMSTDALYTSCLDETLKIYSAGDEATAYMYLFDYRGVNSMVNLLLANEVPLFKTGICHGDDLFYLFDLKIDGLRPHPPPDIYVGERMLTLWSDFAKHGSAPHTTNYEYKRWEKFSVDAPNYYRIGGELRPEVGYKQRETDFWASHLPSLVGTSHGMSARASLSSRPVYKTVAWAMVAVSLSLVVLVAVLLSILYYQKKHDSFRAQSPEPSPSRLSVGSSALY